MLFCDGCAEERRGDQCTKRCREKYGAMTTVTRFPPLDGFMRLDAEDCPREEDQVALRDAHFDRKRAGYRPVDRLQESGSCVVQLRTIGEDGSEVEFGDPVVVRS